MPTGHYTRVPGIHGRKRKNPAETPVHKTVARRAWLVANRDSVRENAKRYNRKNVDRLRVCGAKYKKDFPEKHNASQAARRALKIRQRCVCCTREEIAVIYAIAVIGPCDVDHRIPLALGGHHCVKNLQILNEEDHARKTAKDVRNIAEVHLRNKLLKQWSRRLPFQ
jgi:5-methylcytosine-specific restriction endonuclease McrA